MQALCFALLACAFNLLIGYGGLLSFGHAMFLGTAGYVTAHALKVWGVSPELGILAGTAGAAGVIGGPRPTPAPGTWRSHGRPGRAHLCDVPIGRPSLRNPCVPRRIRGRGS